MSISKTIYILCLSGILTTGQVQASQIEYQLTDLGNNQYEYAYSVTNDNLETAIQEFTVWFGADLYANLIITTLEPLSSQWDEIILEDTGFDLPLGYDALCLGGGIPSGETVGEFAVKFDWLGSGNPGNQYYEIIDPVTFEIIDTGYTVPEPSTMLILIFGSLAIKLKNRNPKSGYNG